MTAYELRKLCREFLVKEGTVYIDDMHQGPGTVRIKIMRSQLEYEGAEHDLMYAIEELRPRGLNLELEIL